jgi:hypothetical protein
VQDYFDGVQIAPICIGPEEGNYAQIGALTLRKRKDDRDTT